MAYLQIHCGYCGGKWEVYSKQRDTAAARYCPHCDSKISEDTWNNYILPAYNNMCASNMQLLNDHVEKHYPEFEVDFVQDGTFANATAAEIKNAVSEAAAYLHNEYNGGKDRRKVSI